MKKFTKLLGIVLIIALVMSMGVSAFADDPEPVYEETIINVTVNENQHTDFKAVQIFKGTQVVDGNDDNKLGDIVWGDGLTEDQKGSIISAVNTVLGYAEGSENFLAADSTAIKVAESIAAMTIDQAEDLAQALHVILKDVAGTVLTNGSTNQVPAGYYLVIDTQASVEEGDAYNASLLQMTKNITIEKKTDAPAQEKKVKEDDDPVPDTTSTVSGTARGKGFNDVADYCIGDTVSYELLSKVPGYHYYDTYYFAFHDKMDPGLTLWKAVNTSNNIKVYINGVLINTTGMDATGLNINTAPEDGCTFEVVFEDLKALIAANLQTILKNEYTAESTVDNVIGKEIKVTFDAVLNRDAKIGDAEGNVNESHIEYSNHPDTNEKGETIPDKVIVFTYELDTMKIAGKGADELNSAAEYYDADGNPADAASAVSATLNGKDYVKGDDGLWHAKLDGAKFVLTNMGKTALFDKNNRFVGWTSSQYYTVNAIITEYQGNRNSTYFNNVYNVVWNEGDNYQRFYRLGVTRDDMITPILTVTSGEVKAIGLDADPQVYVLTEVLAPAGFNRLQDGIPFFIRSTELADRQSWDGTPENALTKLEIWMPIPNITMEGNQSTGVVNMKVENNGGTVLPETGGIGTTLFYTIGSIMVVAAGILLITKKRMSKEG